MDGKIECLNCGKPFTKAHPVQKYCSAACRKRAQDKRRYYRNGKKWDIVTRTCKECGGVFRVTGHSRQKFCCEGCQRTDEKRRRRANKRKVHTEPVYRHEIYIRDGGICQLCGKPIDLDLPYNHDMAISLDHVIPLALGGAHEPNNIQLAHRICNSSKGMVHPDLEMTALAQYVYPIEAGPEVLEWTVKGR